MRPSVGQPVGRAARQAAPRGARRALTLAAALLVLLAPILAPTPLGAQAARGVARRLAERNASRYDDTFRRYSKRFFGVGFDWRLFKAQGLAESGLDPTAVSYVGARGVMQLMPATYKIIASRRSEFGAIDDPEWNIAAGIMHDRYLWSLWKASISEQHRPAFMFGSYNAGEGTIKRARSTAMSVVGAGEEWAHIERVAPTVPRWRYRETLDYVRKIDRYYEGLQRSR
jgi:membrane-bound lytic murein transglycosylase F